MWTEDRVAILTKLWAEGLSASQIAKQLGGVTRNAVIGKVHRLGLSGRATSNRAPRKSATVAATPRASAPRTPTAPSTPTMPRAPKVEREMVPMAAAPDQPIVGYEGGGATVLSLTEHTCKWPIGDPGTEGFHFCGHKSNSDSPYCTEHARLAYQPVQPRRRVERSRGNGFA